MFKKCIKYILFAVFALLIVPASICSLGFCKEGVKVVAKENVSTVARVDSVDKISTSSAGGYTIENYDMDIKIGLDNVFHIVETIAVDFTEYRHGIYRTIVLNNTIERNDGSKSNQMAKVSNLDVNEEYTTSKSNGILEVKIGDPDSYVKGKKTYKISYDYNLGKDNIKEYDELYFNIIGTEWTTIIKSVTFSIEMPKEFDSSTLGFSMGSRGSVGFENLTYSIDGNTISGYTTSNLYSGEGLTVRMELPENYFSEAKDLWTKYLIIGILLPSILLVAVFFVKRYANNHNKFSPTVEFYPPEGLNSLDVAMIYKSTVDNKDVISLLVYLADKGYIKIEEIGNRYKEIKVTKLKEYAGNDSREAMFLGELFERKDSVFLSEISRYTFPKAVSSIAQLTRSRSKEEYFDSKLNNKFKPVLYILSIISLVLSGLVLFITDDLFNLMIFIFPVIGIYLLLPLAIKSKNPFLYIFVLLWGGAPLIGILMPLMSFGLPYVLTSVFGIVVSILISIMLNKTIFRTERGGQLYAKVLGFREFINTAEKDRLEELCVENPSYYYDILPYAYVLGVSSVWIKKFEEIGIPEVDWYVGVNNNLMTLAVFNSITSSITTSSTPIHTSSSGGGGFSGGGSSGGGSGGGGGGSW